MHTRAEAGAAADSGGICFHTLGTAGGTARLRQACQLTEQAFLAGRRVLVWLEDQALLEQMDNLLWTFSDRAFVPHEPLPADPASAQAPVLLHAGSDLPQGIREAGFDMLVMLRETATPAALQFSDVIEVLDGDTACREAGRTRFRYYREHGRNPRHIQVTEDG